MGWVENRAAIMDDTFIKNYIDDVLKSIRTQALLDLIKPFTRVQLDFLSRVTLAFMTSADLAWSEVDDTI